MKKLLKLATVLAVISAILALTLTSYAAIGDIIGEAVHTDIAAYINNFPIKSYNIDGYTSVIAEDLSEYGFTVIWDADARALYITENTAATAITPTKDVKKAAVSKIGKKALDVFSTDIKTYLNGIEIASRNIGGMTIISFEDLVKYGSCNYDNEKRALFLSMERLPSKKYTPVATEFEAGDEITSLSLAADLDVNLTSKGKKLAETIDFTMDFDAVNGVLEANADIKAGDDAMSMKVYGEITDTAIVYYFSVPVIGVSSWYKMSVPIDMTSIEAFAEIDEKEIADVFKFTFIGNEILSGKSVGKYTLSIPAELFKEIAPEVTSGLSFTLFIDENEQLVKLDSDMTDFMQGFIKKSASSDVTVDSAELGMIITGYNTVSGLTVPADIKAGAVDFSVAAALLG